MHVWKCIVYQIAPTFCGQCFCTSCELYRCCKKFCHKQFLKAPLCTGLEASKLQNDESQRSQKFMATEKVWSYILVDMVANEVIVIKFMHQE